MSLVVGSIGRRRSMSTELCWAQLDEETEKSCSWRPDQLGDASLEC
jgi:hypothetical protein